MAEDPKSKDKSVDKGSYELTKKYTRTVKRLKEVADKENIGKDTFEDTSQGFNVEKKTNSAEPKKFKRKVIKTDSRTKIISDDGKTTLYNGDNDDAATEKALTDNERNNQYTNRVRGENADYYNLTSGAKKNLSNKDLSILEKSGKAIRK